MNDPKIGHVSAGVGELIPTGRDQWEVKKLQGWGLNEVPPPVLKSVQDVTRTWVQGKNEPNAEIAECGAVAENPADTTDRWVVHLTAWWGAYT